ncbi:MnhB domain-containing protein [Nitrosomonas sp. Nm34]|uniref:MnhB domain-containing protein n=1 Tax=Nitrosomonas sp. Nm34 TaxID=1881055 RepID=UPI0008DF71CC|nr:MnhB domain-containing protein [Nitrosomonas sp. Nm34]SFI83819.1 Domain related to MnhB subunit of Na+/H+ antiporter [Nitrosomonas sp. Nm34]
MSMKSLLNTLVIIFSATLGATLIWAILELPLSNHIHLSGQVLAQLDTTGVRHPTTAVLLNFRGFDTLLEVMVLLLALLGVLDQTKKCTQKNLSISIRLTQSYFQTLVWSARVLVPVMVLVAGYLLAVGEYQPGGAFQAAAVLAAAGVLLNLSGLFPSWRELSWGFRAGCIFGLLLFLLIAAITLFLSPGVLLQYPITLAGMFILIIEAGLTLSLGLILAGFFLLLSDEVNNKEVDE